MLNFTRQKVGQSQIEGPRKVCVFVSLLLWGLWPSFAGAKDVPVWVYHDFPPFVIDRANQEGLSFDLADRLTNQSNGAYEFKVEVLSRARINHLIAEKTDGLVLWTNHLWFADPNREAFLWSDALFEDRAAVISPKTSPIEYDGPASLMGSDFIGIRGHSYSLLDPLFNDGSISRTDLGSEEQVVLFIADGRADVAVMAELAARYYAQAHGVSDQIYFSNTSHSEFERYILVQPQLTDEHAFILEAMATLQNDAEWRDIMEGHGIKLGPPQAK